MINYSKMGSGQKEAGMLASPRRNYDWYYGIFNRRNHFHHDSDYTEREY
ncbi:MAG: hypothetical protein JSC188_000592 [Candidatus Tokpelaia sp. JSC188]|nr:MAG: hypothetical protein JSC188_000592 [Candidatus Tokpelaia sp. JSC188]